MAVSGIWLLALGETIRASLNSFAVSCPEAQQVKEQLPPAQEKSKSNPIETRKTTKHEYTIRNTSISFCESSEGFIGALCDNVWSSLDTIWRAFSRQLCPKTSSACASNALNELCCEPRAYGLMDNRTAMLGLQKWSIQHFGGILRHCQRRLPRDGCYAAHAVREYQLVPSLRCGPIPNERPWELWHRLTKSDAIEPDSMIHEASGERHPKNQSVSQNAKGFSV